MPDTKGGEPGEPLLVLEEITARVYDRKLLAHTSWTIHRGEQWAVLGPNGSGKSTLVRTIAGDLPSAAGRIIRREDERIALVSFEAQAFVYDRDISFRRLSAGEMRGTLIARTLAARPTLLILDEPFDGLDEASCRSLSTYLGTLISEGAHLILVTHRAEEILPLFTHVISLKAGQVIGMGPREVMLAADRLEELYAPGEGEAKGDLPAVELRSATAPSTGDSARSREALVELRGVTVRYGEHTILRDLEWRLCRGEHWGIMGPNGSGKSTILELISGDNLLGYANDVRVFGRRRGNDMSLWELRKRIGMVSPRLHLAYRHSVPGLEVVLSGFYDSVGLYHRPSDAEIETARSWLHALGISELEERRFSHASYGQRRLLLIARAMVKGPEILILDEPCQGLDPYNRRRVLDAIDTACASTTTSLIYVTHHRDEYPHCLTHVLRLAGPGREVTVERLS